MPEFKNLPKEWISGEVSPNQVHTQAITLGGNFIMFYYVAASMLNNNHTIYNKIKKITN